MKPALSGWHPAQYGSNPDESGCLPVLSGLKPPADGSRPDCSGRGIDATKKLPVERFKRAWPPLIKTEAAVKAKKKLLGIRADG
jgi:hypothetical protein